MSENLKATVANLHNTDPQIRREAILKLGASRQLDAIKPLKWVIDNDPDPALQDLADKGLRFIRQANKDYFDTYDLYEVDDTVEKIKSKKATPKSVRLQASVWDALLALSIVLSLWFCLQAFATPFLNVNAITTNIHIERVSDALTNHPFMFMPGLAPFIYVIIGVSIAASIIPRSSLKYLIVTGPLFPTVLIGHFIERLISTTRLWGVLFALSLTALLSLTMYYFSVVSIAESVFNNLGLTPTTTITRES
ncbi:MAG: hypothetical protein AAF126_19350, partial [Chloroflexota bacterium]